MHRILTGCFVVFTTRVPGERGDVQLMPESIAAGDPANADDQSRLVAALTDAARALPISL